MGHWRGRPFAMLFVLSWCLPRPSSENVVIVPSMSLSPPQVFDEFASNYDSSRNWSFYGDLAQTLLERCAPLTALAEGDFCVDLACGTGNATSLAVLRHPEQRWVGIDVSAAMLASAERRGLPRTFFVQGAATRLPLASGSVRWMICNLAYHWMDPASVGEILRVLQIGGCVSIMAPLRFLSFEKRGNEWLSKTFAKHAKLLRRRRSCGFSLEELGAEFANLEIKLLETVPFVESYTSLLELFTTLRSRGSLQAMCGEEAEIIFAGAEEALVRDCTPAAYEWRMGLLHARRAE